MRIRLKRREQVSGTSYIVSFSIALLTALMLTALLIHSSGQDVITAYRTLLWGAFGGKEEIFESLVRATPLIFTGLATVIAFRARIWSIGQEGQYVLGAITAYWLTTQSSGLISILLIPVGLVAGTLGGALLGALSGWLKSRYRVDEIISTVMLNYIVIYLLSYLLSGPWQKPGSYHLHTGLTQEASWLPVLFDFSRLHIGILIALVMVFLTYLLLNRMTLGYEIRALGFNPRACAFKGMNISRKTVSIMLISGGFAGLAGAIDLLGVHQRLSIDIQSGLGYTGILIAMLGGLTPLGTLLAAILFGGLLSGGLTMQVLTGVPLAIVYTMQALIILCFLCSALAARYQIVRHTDV